MNINEIIKILLSIRELILCDIYDAEAMRELEPSENWPSRSKQLRAIKLAVNFLRKLRDFSENIVYFNSNKEV